MSESRCGNRLTCGPSCCGTCVAICGLQPSHEGKHSNTISWDDEARQCFSGKPIADHYPSQCSPTCDCGAAEAKTFGELTRKEENEP